jgi:hypothetical protein
MNALDGVNAAIPGGFDAVWGDFLEKNWNQAPFDDYGLLDNLPFGSTVEDIGVTLLGQPDRAIELDVAVPHLAAQYFHLRFPDSSVSSVAIYNGYSWLLGLEEFPDFGSVYSHLPLTPEHADGALVRALVKRAGSDWVSEDWTMRMGGRGLGKLLYSALFDALKGEDLRMALAAITLPNEASVRLHLGFGFQQTGVLHEVGRKFDRYWDVAWFEKRLP